MTDSVQKSSSLHAANPVGIFDSGIGGLSVARHIRTQLPDEDLLYFADSGFAPYGDKSESAVIERSSIIVDFLLQAGCKALVVACNTATASAIHILRERYPAFPIVGIEPGLKPAAAATKSGTVGVMATERTLSSTKFHHLQTQLADTTGVRFVMQACVGLADMIEEGNIHSDSTLAMVRRYVEPLLSEGADTLVLGCTHYPFIRHAIEAACERAGVGPVGIVDTGEAVARQLERLLDAAGLRRTGAAGTLRAFTTGDATLLLNHFDRLLRLTPSVTNIA